MKHTDLVWLKENIADPAMLRLYERTEIPEGFTCIDNLDIAFLDGRSCGTKSTIMASGLQYKDGKVTPYFYEKADFDAAEFVQAHLNCVFCADGKLRIYDELAGTEIKGKIRNMDLFSLLFRGLPNRNDLQITNDCVEYLKMKHLQQQEKDATLPANAFLCTGIASDGCLFSIQQHDIQSDNSYFSFYVVDATPKDMSPDTLEQFLIVHADRGCSVAGSLAQVMDEFQDFMQDLSVEQTTEKASSPQSLNSQIDSAKEKVKPLVAPSQHSHEPEPDI